MDFEIPSDIVDSFTSDSIDAQETEESLLKLRRRLQAIQTIREEHKQKDAAIKSLSTRLEELEIMRERVLQLERSQVDRNVLAAQVKSLSTQVQLLHQTNREYEEELGLLRTLCKQNEELSDETCRQRDLIFKLQSDISKLEDRNLSTSNSLDVARQECTDLSRRLVEAESWELKYHDLDILIGKQGRDVEALQAQVLSLSAMELRMRKPFQILDAAFSLLSTDPIMWDSSTYSPNRESKEVDFERHHANIRTMSSSLRRALEGEALLDCPDNMRNVIKVLFSISDELSRHHDENSKLKDDNSHASAAMEKAANIFQHVETKAKHATLECDIVDQIVLNLTEALEDGRLQCGRLAGWEAPNSPAIGKHIHSSYSATSPPLRRTRGREIGSNLDHFDGLEQSGDFLHDSPYAWQILDSMLNVRDSKDAVEAGVDVSMSLARKRSLLTLHANVMGLLRTAKELHRENQQLVAQAERLEADKAAGERLRAQLQAEHEKAIQQVWVQYEEQVAEISRINNEAEESVTAARSESRRQLEALRHELTAEYAARLRSVDGQAVDSQARVERMEEELRNAQMCLEHVMWYILAQQEKTEELKTQKRVLTRLVSGYENLCSDVATLASGCIPSHLLMDSAFGEHQSLSQTQSHSQSQGQSQIPLVSTKAATLEFSATYATQVQHARESTSSRLSKSTSSHFIRARRFRSSIPTLRVVAISVLVAMRFQRSLLRLREVEFITTGLHAAPPADKVTVAVAKARIQASTIASGSLSSAVSTSLSALPQIAKHWVLPVHTELAHMRPRYAASLLIDECNRALAHALLVMDRPPHTHDQEHEPSHAYSPLNFAKEFRFDASVDSFVSEFGSTPRVRASSPPPWMRNSASPSLLLTISQSQRSHLRHIQMQKKKRLQDAQLAGGPHSPGVSNSAPPAPSLLSHHPAWDFAITREVLGTEKGGGGQVFAGSEVSLVQRTLSDMSQTIRMLREREADLTLNCHRQQDKINSLEKDLSEALTKTRAHSSKIFYRSPSRDHLTSDRHRVASGRGHFACDTEQHHTSRENGASEIYGISRQSSSDRGRLPSKVAQTSTEQKTSSDAKIQLDDTSKEFPSATHDTPQGWFEPVSPLTPILSERFYDANESDTIITNSRDRVFLPTHSVAHGLRSQASPHTPHQDIKSTASSSLFLSDETASPDTPSYLASSRKGRPRSRARVASPNPNNLSIDGYVGKRIFEMQSDIY